MYRTHNFLLLIILYGAACFGLPSDSKAPLHIVSDHSTFNYKNGTNEFIGNVIIDQGSTHLSADRVITKNNAQHKIEEAIAYGIKQPGHYWTLPKVGDPTLHAYANVIKFYPLSTNVSLEQHVTVKQGDNNFQGELIHYNSNDQTITVPHLEKSQAVLVYNPDK